MNTKHKKLMLQDVIISAIIISQNDQDIIEDRLEAISKTFSKLGVNYEILVVDNNSQDNTIEKIRKINKAVPFIRIIKLSKRYDTDIALTAGLDNCIGDYAVLFNIYEDPPEMLPVFIDKLLENYDIVIGKPSKGIIKYGFLSKIFLRIIEKLSTHEFYYSQNYLIALNRKAINSITRTRRKSRNFSYINYLIGFKKCVINYTPLKKFKYKLKKEGFLKLFFNVIDIIISNSFRPMRILSFLGMVASILFLVYVFLISLIAIFFDKHIAPQGWISVSTVIGIMFFLLFSVLTLISEYIIRILNESRNEPLYFVADELDKSIILTEKDSLNVI